MLICRRIDNFQVQPFRYCKLSVEPWTWKTPLLWYSVCTLYALFFCFLLHDEDRSPWDPLAMSTSLQHCPRQRVTHRPSCWERICYLSTPLLRIWAPNRALGMCCNLTECQIALLDWAFLVFSGDCSVLDETGWEWLHKGTCHSFARDYFFKIMLTLLCWIKSIG